MKITLSQLKQIIKEEVSAAAGGVNPLKRFGGRIFDLAARGASLVHHDGADAEDLGHQWDAFVAADGDESAAPGWGDSLRAVKWLVAPRAASGSAEYPAYVPKGLPTPELPDGVTVTAGIVAALAKGAASGEAETARRSAVSRELTAATAAHPPSGKVDPYGRSDRYSHGGSGRYYKGD